MSNRAAETAIGPTVMVAVEQNFPPEKRLIHDDVAYRLLPPSMRALVALTRFPPLRSLLIGMTEGNTPGIWGGIVRRKRYGDDKLVESLQAGISAVVNLGAGLDTRAYRFPALKNLSVFEVDLPANVEYKRSRLRQLYGRVPEHVTLVATDFDREDLGDVLRAHGHKVEDKTFFIWEGVTQYLTESGVRRTMDYLAKAQTGSRLEFTYVVQDFLDGTNNYGLSSRSQAVRIRDQFWHFGLAPDRVAAFLAEYGWREVEQMGSREALAWYPSPSGRTLGVPEVELAVYAEKV